MNRLKFLTLLITLTLFAATVRGQQTYQLEFDETGKMLSAPPSMMEDGDSLKVVLHTSSTFYQNRLIAVHNLYANTIKALSQTESDGSFSMLKSWNLPATAKDVILKVRAKLANELISLDTWPEYAKLLSKQIDTMAEIKRMKKYNTVSATLAVASFASPSFKNLMDMKFSFKVQVLNFNGLKTAIICDTTVNLKKATDTCCQVAYATGVFAIRYVISGPVQYKFELRLNNPSFDEFIRLLKSKDDQGMLDRMQQLDIDSLTAKVNSYLNFELVKFPDKSDAGDNKKLIADLKDYIQKKEGGKDDTVAQNSISKRLVSVKSPLYTSIRSSLDDALKVVLPLQTPAAFTWLMQSLWLSSGKILTGNPLATGASSVKDQIDASNKAIRKLQQDSLAYLQKTTMLENLSKTNLQKGDMDNLLQRNDTLAKQKSVNAASLETARASLAKLQTQQKKENQQAQALKNSTFQDSLFYQGTLLVNHLYDKDYKVKQWLFNPILPYFAFMRHHDAAQDFHLMGRDPVIQINEKQRMYILVENATQKTKVVLSTKIADITLANDIGPLSEISGVNSSLPLPGGSLAPPADADPAKSLYTSYENVKKSTSQAVAPFQTGILTLPVPKQSDVSPNFMTKIISHEEPYHAPSAVTYALMDSATNVNLNSEKTVYSYRFNKLYRFRLKAGIVYSWLETNSYTISNNTATLTKNYTKLAPAFGLQIFTSKIDVQQTRLMPTGIYPFLYVGYLYSSAAANNFLVGGGYELFSGVAIIGGLHFGQSQLLTVQNGLLGTRNTTKSGGFISLSIGLEAFNSIFNTTKPANPFK